MIPAFEEWKRSPSHIACRYACPLLRRLHDLAAEAARRTRWHWLHTICCAVYDAAHAIYEADRREWRRADWRARQEGC